MFIIEGMLHIAERHGSEMTAVPTVTENEACDVLVG
jgi:hypothetical protein